MINSKSIARARDKRMRDNSRANKGEASRFFGHFPTCTYL